MVSWLLPQKAGKPPAFLTIESRENKKDGETKVQFSVDSTGSNACLQWLLHCLEPIVSLHPLVLVDPRILHAPLPRISPKNFFLFTLLLLSVAVGTLSPSSFSFVARKLDTQFPLKSILQPTRYLTRHKKRGVTVIEAEATKVDVENRTVTFADKSDILLPCLTASFVRFADAPPRCNATSWIVSSQPGSWGSQRMRLIGGGPTGVELRIKILTGTMVKEVKPNSVLLQRPGGALDEVPYGMVVWAAGNTGMDVTLDLMGLALPRLASHEPPSRAMAYGSKAAARLEATAQALKLPYFCQFIWASRKFIEKPGSSRAEPRLAGIHGSARLGFKWLGFGLDVAWSQAAATLEGADYQGFLDVLPPPGTIFAIGDCTATSYAPTAQVASQQGAYLGRLLKGIARREALEARASETKANEMSLSSSQSPREATGNSERSEATLVSVKFRSFHYSHQGSLAYIRSEKAIADLPFMNGNELGFC
ncbi:hypothetical protein C8J56DRAFT_1119709 [Mycena floridula]|nr:hypothetical protein C8J56DRAFT_1119709 [Mycena floridula]